MIIGPRARVQSSTYTYNILLHLCSCAAHSGRVPFRRVIYGTYQRIIFHYFLLFIFFLQKSLTDDDGRVRPLCTPDPERGTIFIVAQLVYGWCAVCTRIYNVRYIIKCIGPPRLVLQVRHVFRINCTI